MAARGLLSRLAESAGTEPPGPGGRAEAIAEHLRALLNARKGSAAVAPELGLSDFNDVVHALPAAAARIQQEIRRAVEEFEPRLEAVSVRPVRGEGGVSELAFEITARLKGGGVLRLRTRLGAGGRVELSRR